MSRSFNHPLCEDARAIGSKDSKDSSTSAETIRREKFIILHLSWVEKIYLSFKRWSKGIYEFERQTSLINSITLLF